MISSSLQPTKGGRGGGGGGGGGGEEGERRVHGMPNLHEFHQRALNCSFQQHPTRNFWRMKATFQTCR